MNKKKQTLLMILGILSLVAITIGVTYAFFSYTKQGTTENTVTTGTITFLYTEIDQVGAGISLTNAFPISDSQGKALTGTNEVFDFKITSNTPSNSNIPYEITARKKQVENMLDEEAVKIYLTKNNGTEEEVLLDNFSNLTQTTKVSKDKYIEKTLHTDKVTAGTNYEQAYRLRMWVDESVDFSPVKDEQGNDTYPYNGKEFTVTINVYANAKVVTEEEIANESKAEISNLTVDGTELTTVENEDYNYETSLPEGTTSTTIKIETQSPNAEVKVERLDSLAYTSNMKRLSTQKTLELTPGNNYFKITVISENKQVENEFILKINVGKYTEAMLNGTDPVLSDNLIPILIADDGTVTKADISKEWYKYENQRWANAVVLKDETITYENNEVIPEENIESYFVWIPRYKYKLFDTGSYTGLTTISNKEQIIDIRFGLTDTSDSNEGECTTLGVAGESGNCEVGEYMTHPAFQTFDSTGFWVGKFETGYDGATSTAGAQVNTVNTGKIVIKPNTYSWRNITVGNAFKNSYDYLRSSDSHMMKNIEWGAVAYLQHSNYGSHTSVRINNNSAYITGYAGIEEPTKGYSATSIEGNRYQSTSLDADGTYTKRYNSETGYLASTTGNITGIYDMSGGAAEYVAGYTTGSSIGIGGYSGITSLYSNFYNDSTYTKYWDKYSSTTYTNYNNRILGDATGEIGPFGNIISNGNTRRISSWYGDYVYFSSSSLPWLTRGGIWYNGTETGMFATLYGDGGNTSYMSFRIVLTPTK